MNQINKLKIFKIKFKTKKRQLVQLNTAEHENSNLKDNIEIYKQQLREKEIIIEQHREQQEQLYLDNKKMKAKLDLLNFELKKQQENFIDQLHRTTIQITELQRQMSTYYIKIANQAHQIQLQKQQVKQLEIKEKELYSTKNQQLKLEESIQNLKLDFIGQKQLIRIRSYQIKKQLIQQVNRIRNLENDLQSQSFNQKFNTIRIPQTSDQLFTNQQQLFQSNTLKGSFNHQFNLYK